ncbi:MAG: flavodoxin reductase [Flavobacteriales bacterium]|nr:flavodoxin reductase [Flavobacteriales bacterium]MCB9166081.1 flavodoxin reductase [Flavobacteriales bacterium]
MPHPVKVLRTEFITPDVKRFTVERPQGYKFVPGQATDVAIDRPGWTDKLRPFTFTNTTTARHLEFIIKIYGDHDGVTKQLGLMHAGEGLLLHAPFGAITYQGPGFFIAGGAGVTPFVAILRDLHRKKKLKGNTLLVSNHTAMDVILDEEFTRMLGRHFLKVFTRQHVIGFRERRIDRDMLVVLVQNFDQKFYVCGPGAFVNEIGTMLLDLGAKAESLVVEQ